MPKRRRHPTALVLSGDPQRQQLRRLQAQLNERRDHIAEVDLEIETLREQLVTFESTVQARMAEEHEALRQIESVTRHMERWAQLLHDAARPQLVARARRLNERRNQEMKQRTRRKRARVPAPPPEEPLPPADERLKAAFRALARRFHPDLARTEDERMQFGQRMARINELYRLGDLARLEAMAEQAKGGEVENMDLEVDEQVDHLAQRLKWFDAVLENLHEEHRNLEASPTCELWRDVLQAEAVGRDLIAELKTELRDRVEQTYQDVPAAIKILEDEVERYNRQAADPAAMQRSTRRRTALTRQFDPFANKKLIRMSLEALATYRVSKAAQELAKWIQVEGPRSPGVLRLLLFGYVCELSPLPLKGLESHADLKLRYDHLAAEDDPPLSFAKALVAADDLVEFGIRRADKRLAQVGLRFRDQTTRDATLLALRALPIRREFRRVLLVLGEHAPCPNCAADIFAVPLYRTRGLDDLRANLCPKCGHTLASYWMPKGQDVQAVLNTAYLDFEIIAEFSFRLARSSVATQMLPVQLERAKVGDLKKHLFADLFDRYELGLKPQQVRLKQNRKRVAERTPLVALESHQFRVALASDAPLSEIEAAELLRHRIRNRFKDDPA